MKLLICTQVVDKNHPILGFFHRWIEEFAKHCDTVEVICLFEGEHTLPANVHVHSLGKEEGKNRLKYLIRFYAYIWNLRNEYDNIFVHMNQIYVILGAPLWRLLGKRIGLWYAHGKVSNSLKIAEKFAHILFTSTEEGLQLATPKKKIVGQGIDLNHFTYTARNTLHTPLRFITVGRISQTKNLETLIDACSLLKEKGVAFHFSIIGVSITDEEKLYEQRMREKVDEQGLSDLVEWVGAVSQQELPSKLQEADIFIHDSGNQSLDKALIEAVLCGCIVVSSNASYQNLTKVLGCEYVFRPNDHRRLAEIIEKNMASPIRNTIRNFFYKEYGIDALVNRVLQNYQ